MVVSLCFSTEIPKAGSLLSDLSPDLVSGSIYTSNRAGASTSVDFLVSL